MNIIEQQIIAWAPNAAAVANGKKISQKGGFVSRMKSADETFFMGECTGSGKSNYVTSIDFINEAEPVFRCSCPSRQFPCKHSIALLFEMMSGKEFATEDIPADILDKRAKKDAREAKKVEAVSSDGTVKEKKKSTSSAGKAAKIKKMNKQLEGLAMLREMLDKLLQSGLATMAGTSTKVYKDLAKQLGNYYLPGPQGYINMLTNEMEQFQKDADEMHYQHAIKIVVRLNMLLKKSEQYIQEKIASGQLDADNNILYEELGGIWQLEQLKELGLFEENKKFLQLSFHITYDSVQKEYIDKGYWIALDSGEIHTTLNLRPAKAVKYIKQEDSIFGIVEAPVVVHYPGGSNCRIRFEGEKIIEAEAGVYEAVRLLSKENYAEEIKAVKNELKNTLSESYVMKLFRIGEIGTIQDALVIEDQSGTRLLLKDMDGEGETVNQLLHLPSQYLQQGDALLGAVYYNQALKRMCVQPYSVVTKNAVVRLMY